MKRLFLSAVFLLSAILSFAQPSAVTNAALLHKENQLDKALTEINSAVQHDKTKDDPKAWYYRGLIYQSILSSEDPAIKGLAQNAGKEALSSYKKVIEFDPKKGEYSKLSNQNMDALFPAFINKGYGEYNTYNFTAALESFEMAQAIRPDDTTGYIYGAFAAEELGRYDLIKNFSEKLDQLNYKSAQLCLYKISIAENLDKNPAKALEIATVGLQNYPVNLPILQEQTNLFITLDKPTEAINNLNLLLTLRPGDIDYMLMLASLYDQTGEKEKAMKFYNKVLEKDPANYIALYNSSVIYYEQGKKLNEQIHAMSMSDYHTEGKKKEAEQETVFSKALERAEKAKTIATEPGDKQNITVLITNINKILTDEQESKTLHK